MGGEEVFPVVFAAAQKFQRVQYGIALADRKASNPKRELWLLTGMAHDRLCHRLGLD
jgi:hypothetical protein